MPRYTITARTPQWVDFYYSVEADSPESAMEAYQNGEADSKGYEAVETIGFLPTEDITIEEDKPCDAQ